MNIKTRLAAAVSLVSACIAVLVATSGTAFAQDASADGEIRSGQATNWFDEDVWSNPERGFNWYPPDPEPKRKPKLKAKKKPDSAQKDIRELTSFEDVEKELNRLKAVAVFDQTEENVLAYLRAQEYVLSKSARFADVARRVVWQNPDVDGNARQPIATYSAITKRERVEQDRKVAMADISKTHGLVFFFRGDCPFCHDFAPIVKALSDQYGVQVVPVSMDGGALPTFPQPRIDNGISRFVSNGRGIDVVPALYLVSNDTKTVQLVGTGALAAEEVLERIRVLTTTKPGEEM